MKKLIHLFFAASCLYSGMSVAQDELLTQKPVLTLAGAKYIAAASAKKARDENWNVVIVVSDGSGKLKYLESMDNVQLSSIETAIKKAETAVMYRRPTKVFQARIADGEIPLTMLPNMLPFEGGLPIIVDGHVIGAVGVSGVQVAYDAEIAQTGIDAYLKKVAK